MGFFDKLVQVVTSDAFQDFATDFAKGVIQGLQEEQDKKDNPTSLFGKASRSISNTLHSGKDDLESANRNNMMNAVYSSLNRSQYERHMSKIQREINKHASSINKSKEYVKVTLFPTIAQKLNSMKVSGFEGIQYEDVYQLKHIAIVPIDDIISTLKSSFDLYLSDSNSKEQAKNKLLQSVANRDRTRTEEDYLNSMVESQKIVEKVYETVEDIFDGAISTFEIQSGNLDIITSYKRYNGITKSKDLPQDYAEQLRILLRLQKKLKKISERKLIGTATLAQIESYQQHLYQDYQDIEQLHKSSVCLNETSDYKAIETTESLLSLNQNSDVEKRHDRQSSIVKELRYTNGDTYEGQVSSDRKRNGQGTYIFKDGRKIRGSWTDDNPIQGKDYYTSGDMYEGTFNTNWQRHGQGTYYWKSGEKYEGEWSNGDRHGIGKYYAANGCIIQEGEWVKDNYVGRGKSTNTYKSSSQSQQQTSISQRVHKLLYPNGDAYEGQISSDRKRNGEGTYTCLDCTKYCCIWKDDTPIKGTAYYTNGDKYKGSFNTNWQRHGQGTYYLKNGEKYVGEWSNGDRHGIGKYYSANGCVKQEGKWANDTFTGKERSSSQNTENNNLSWRDASQKAINLLYDLENCSYEERMYSLSIIENLNVSGCKVPEWNQIIRIWRQFAENLKVNTKTLPNPDNVRYSQRLETINYSSGVQELIREICKLSGR